MIAMKFTIEVDIGLSFVLQAALPQLVTDRETKLIVVGEPSDRTGNCRAAPPSRRRIVYWNTIYTQHALDDLPHDLAGDELAGLTPTLFEHVNPLGTYTFDTAGPPARRAAPAAARSQRRVSFH
jgi:hypothetical protein